MKAARMNRLGPSDVIAIEDIAIPSAGEADAPVRACDLPWQKKRHPI